MALQHLFGEFPYGILILHQQYRGVSEPFAKAAGGVVAAA